MLTGPLLFALCPFALRPSLLAPFVLQFEIRNSKSQSPSRLPLCALLDHGDLVVGQFVDLENEPVNLVVEVGAGSHTASFGKRCDSAAVS